MHMTAELVHERTLIGAVDSYLKELVHVRPFLVQRYTDILEGMSERWLAQTGNNELNALDNAWLTDYIGAAADQQLTLTALQDFYRWAIQGNLITHNPLSAPSE